MIYGYARVSTKGQQKDGNSVESQTIQLKDAGAIKVYIDSFTGTKTDRPELNKLLKELKSGDTLVITKLDRLSRTVKQGIILIDDLIEKDIKVNVLNLGILDSSSMSTFMRNILLAFAQLERDLIVSRTQEGKAIAKANNPNFKEGKPKQYTKTQLDYAIKLLETNSYSEVEKMTKISKSTLVRYKRTLN